MNLSKKKWEHRNLVSGNMLVFYTSSFFQSNLELAIEPLVWDRDEVLSGRTGSDDWPNIVRHPAFVII